MGAKRETSRLISSSKGPLSLSHAPYTLRRRPWNGPFGRRSERGAGLPWRYATSWRQGIREGKCTAPTLPLPDQHPWHASQLIGPPDLNQCSDPPSDQRRK